MCEQTKVSLIKKTHGCDQTKVSIINTHKNSATGHEQTKVSIIKKTHKNSATYTEWL